MNRACRFAAVLAVAFTACGNSNDSVVPVTPTVFFLSREANPYRASDSERPMSGDLQLVVDAARKILVLDDSDHFENIIILDEGDCWFVSFHARGNGKVRFERTAQDADDSGYFLVNTNAGIYLNKKDLARAKHVPENRIRSLPLVSPIADRVQGLGLVVGPEDDESKH